MEWKPGDRFSYVMMKGGWAHGTVIKVDEDRVTGKLDCQKPGDIYCFNANSHYFIHGEVKNDD